MDMVTSLSVDGREIKEFMSTLSAQLEDLCKQQSVQTELLHCLVKQPKAAGGSSSKSLAQNSPVKEAAQPNARASFMSTKHHTKILHDTASLSHPWQQMEARIEDATHINVSKQTSEDRKDSIIRRKIPQWTDGVPMAASEMNPAVAELVESDDQTMLDHPPSDPFQHHNICKLMEQIVLSAKFEITFISIIILNSIVMGCELQFSGQEAGMDLGFGKAHPKNHEGIFGVLNEAFLWIFVGELVLKLMALRCNFWRFFWNWLDFAVVLFGVFERFGPDDGLDPMVIRLLRLTKLTRVLKFFKMGSHLQSWHLILKSISSTRDTLFWSMLLLFMIQCVTGMLVAQLAYGIYTDPSKSLEARQKVFRFYGTFTRTQFTMFEVTFVNFSTQARVLVDEDGEAWVIFFILYRCVVSFAVMQVIRAVFIQQTLKVAETDKELLLVRKLGEERRMTENLNQIFDRGDQRKSGFLEYHQLRDLFKDPAVRVYMQTLDIDSGDADALWSLLDLNGNGKISRNEFVLGSSKVRGKATCLDMFQVHALTEQISTKLEDLKHLSEWVCAWTCEQPAGHGSDSQVVEWRTNDPSTDHETI